MAALEVRRNAIISLIVGTVFTVAVFLFFVVIPGTAQQLSYLIALGFVLALTSAGSVLIVLTVYRTYVLSRDLEDVGEAG